MHATFALFATLVLPAAAAPELALRGLDPVALCAGNETPGREDLEARLDRYTYRFANAENHARFVAHPERWGIQWSGGCGRMGPMSGAASPDRWAVHGERIYIFASDGCREDFLAAPGRFVTARPELPPFDQSAREAGQAWIEKAVAAHGGARAIDAAQSVRLASRTETNHATIEIELRISSDGTLVYRERWTGPDPESASEATWSAGADSVHFDDRGGTTELTSPELLDDVRRFASREPITLLWARNDAGFVAVHRGQRLMSGIDGDKSLRPVESVLVQHAGPLTALHLDPDDGRILALSWRGRLRGGVTHDVVEVITDYRDVADVLFPTERTVTADAERVRSVTWDRVKFAR